MSGVQAPGPGVYHRNDDDEMEDGEVEDHGTTAAVTTTTTNHCKETSYHDTMDDYRVSSKSRHYTEKSYDHKERSGSESSMSPSRSRSGHHDRYSKSHDKKRKQKRHRHRRHRSRSSSRSDDSRSKSRSRSRSESRSRSYHSQQRRNYNYDDREHYYSSSEDYGDRNNQDRANESYKYQEPNCTVMVRGLAVHLKENDIREDVIKCGLFPKDIRVIRNRETGASRGFAFVEFVSVTDSTKWMEMKKGVLILQDEYEATLIYSVPKASHFEHSRTSLLNDWYCVKCQAHNFKRREFCYKCQSPKPDDNKDLDMVHETSSSPTSTIVLKNLGPLITEECVLQAFQARPMTLACIPIKSVRIAREPLTNLSRGICYVELNNVADAVNLFYNLSRDGIEIDGHNITTAYSKPMNNPGAVKSNVAATALAAAQWTNSSSGSITSVIPPSVDQNDPEQMAAYSANLYAKTSEEHERYLNYYRGYYHNLLVKKGADKASFSSASSTIASSNGPVTYSSSSSSSFSFGVLDNETTKAAGSYSHSSLFSPGRSESSVSVDAVKASNSNSSSCSQSTAGPDMSRFKYDESSGYYYDDVSKLYYDSASQYFYDATNRCFLYWDSQKTQYVTVDNSSNTASSQHQEQPTEVPPLKQDKVKVAKKIAKDMQKWAKTLNQKKDRSSLGAAADNQTVWYGSPVVPKSDNVMPAVVNVSSRTPPLEPAEDNIIEALDVPDCPFDESESDEERDRPDDSSFADFNKLACLLCKRQFSTKEMVIKHMTMSELHKQNLAAVGIAEVKPGTSSEPKIYRDRAKERRDKFGVGTIKTNNALRDLYEKTREALSTSLVEEPTKGGIKDSNIGNRMLQKMGWHQGQGLGKSNQGNVNFIQTERRAGSVGLGNKGVHLVDTSDMDRYQKSRHLTLARYQELDE